MALSVAALFVRKINHYQALGCDCYDYERDAMTWPGGVPAVYHPPCRAWGRYAHVSKHKPAERLLSLWAIDQVRRYGGVLEHPITSKLWIESGCLSYGVRDSFGGVLLPVYQNWFGHRAIKATGIYVVGPLPDLSAFDSLPVNPETTVEGMGRAERERTPEQFAKWLVMVASSCAGWVEKWR